MLTPFIPLLKRGATRHITFLLINFLATGCFYESELEKTLDQGEAPKNIILVVGDGMGPSQIAFGALFARHTKTGRIAGQQLWINRMLEEGQMGMAYPYAYNSLTIDSAASASQLATGKPSGSEMIGLDEDGNPVETVLELAQERGKATGLVSNTRLTHATPAAFAAHVAHRSQENEIASQMLKTGPDVMLSGGLRHFLPASIADQSKKDYANLRKATGNNLSLVSRRQDDRNLIQEAEDAGYRTVFTRDQLRSVQRGKLLGLFSESGMPDAIQEERSKDDSNRSKPTLYEMTETAIKVLSQDPDGFFLVVEGGQIDWAAHSNDAGTMLHEVVRFDEVVGYVYRWAKQNKETLVIVTADHETGLPGFSYGKVDVPAPTNLSGKAFAEKKYAPNYNFVPTEHVDRLYRQKKSLFDIAIEFESLPEKSKTPSRLQRLINDNMQYSISAQEAKYILTREGRASGKDQKHNHAEHADYLAPFYPYSDGLINHRHLVEVLAPKQMIVWGTGTHSSTPVPVIAYMGNEASVSRKTAEENASEKQSDASRKSIESLFSRSFMPNSELGVLLKEIVRGSKVSD